MASKYLQKFPVPQGFQQILADLTEAVLRDQPKDIVPYAAEYFQLLENGKKIDYQGPSRRQETLAQIKKQDDISKRAANIAQHVGQIIEAIPTTTKSHQKIDAQQKQLPLSQKQIVQIGSQKTVTNSEVGHYIDQVQNEVVFQKKQHSQYKLPSKQKKHIHESIEQIFARFDVDNSGSLQYKEVKEFILEALKGNVVQNQAFNHGIEGLIKQFGHQGKLNKNDLFNYINTIYQQEAAQKFQQEAQQQVDQEALQKAYEEAAQQVEQKE